MPDVWLRTPVGMFPAREDADDHDLSPCYVRLRDYRALLDRAEHAEAERDAAFAAGQEEMRERAAADVLEWGTLLTPVGERVDEDVADDIRALPLREPGGA